MLDNGFKFVPRLQEIMLRGRRHCVRQWGDPALPRLLALHGWMDGSATFQFLAEGLSAQWSIWALDWRGFGLSEKNDAAGYEFSDYLGDLDAWCEQCSPDQPVNLLAHSMGGNLALLYAGIRPERVRSVVNLEGLGLLPQAADEAPARWAQWLSQQRQAPRLASYDGPEAYAQRLIKRNPRLPPERARYLAAESGQYQGERWVLHADPLHKVVNRTSYRVEEVNAAWARVEAPVLWVEGEESPIRQRMWASPGYAERVALLRRRLPLLIPEAGHWVHAERPELLVSPVNEFLWSVRG